MMKTARLMVVLAMLGSTLLIGLAAPAGAGGGATQISGYIPENGGPACDSAPDGFGDYAFPLVGDLVGCVYGSVTDFKCTPTGSGDAWVYKEIADEIFVSADPEMLGTFEMTEFFFAKFLGEPCNFDDIQGQTLGGCKHPIVEGTGTGAFEGVSGRLDFQDDVRDVDPDVFAWMRGHLKGI